MINSKVDDLVNSPLCLGVRRMALRRGCGGRWWDYAWEMYIMVAAVVVVLLLRWVTMAPRERRKREAAATAAR